MSNNVVQKLDQTAYNELLTAQPTPLAQINASKGLLDKVGAFSLNGGSTEANNSLFESISGTDAAGTASVVTLRQASSRAGQGVLCRVDSIFDTPRTDNVQHAGLININNRFVFAFHTDKVFGISHVFNGELEIQELDITTPAAGAENATITVDGTGFTVPLTAGTIEHNAFEIAADLNIQVTGYSFTSNFTGGVATVVAKSLLPAPSQGGGSFAFTSATAIAVWAQIQASVEPTTTHIAQTDWNINKLPLLDPLKGNRYEVKYLEFGPIQFFVNSLTGAGLILVHQINHQNTTVLPSVSVPVFRVGWLTINSGNTTSVNLKGYSAAIFIEGEINIDEPTRADENTSTTITNTSLRNIITLRNRLVFGNKQNRYDIFGLFLTITNESSKTVRVDARVNATFDADMEFAYTDKAKSIMEVAKDDVAITGGRKVAGISIPPGGTVTLPLEQIKALLLPNSTLTVAGILTGAGPASDVTANAIWQEDL